MELVLFCSVLCFVSVWVINTIIEKDMADLYLNCSLWARTHD